MSEGSSEKRALRSDARRAEKVIRSLLLEWDATGAGMVPDDEYDCMIWLPCKLIRSSNEEIAGLVGDQRRGQFGLEDDRKADRKLAECLLARSLISCPRSEAGSGRWREVLGDACGLAACMLCGVGSPAVDSD